MEPSGGAETLTVENLLVYPVVVAFLALLVAGFLFQGRPLRGDALDPFEKLARTIQGTIDPGSWFRRPRLAFDASGCPAEITWSPVGRDGDLWLLVTVWGVPAGDLKIWRRSRPWRPRLEPPWRCPLVVLGDPSIDGELGIRSRPPALAERLFAPERRATAAELFRSLAGDDTLSIRRNVLRTNFTVNSMSTRGISDLVSRIRRLTALLQESAG